MDRRGLLYVAGGTAGNGRVVSVRTGKILASYDFDRPGTPTFVNDVVLTKRYAWFTDSQQAAALSGRADPDRQGSRVGRRRRGTADRVTGIQRAGFNANGIAQTPNGRALLVINSGTGFLFRVNPRRRGDPGRPGRGRADQR